MTESKAVPMPGAIAGPFLVVIGLAVAVIGGLWPFAMTGAFADGMGWMMIAAAVVGLQVLGIGVLVMIARRMCAAIEQQQGALAAATRRPTLS